MHQSRFVYSLIAATALLAGAATARAIVIGPDQGARFDGILDGFPMIAALDGTPDFGGNQLGVGLKNGSTEERGVGEFPTAPLGGASGERIASATLTFNIDDVLVTFGPGTEFTGAAAEEILVYVYAGDGEVAVGDYLAVARPAHVVDTRAHGRITDATLRRSGPLVFEVDITDDVRALLADGPAAIGIVWRTMDTPTGTSLDNLGDGSLGPPGVNGSFLPYLTVELAADATPTPTPTAPVAGDTPSPTPTATAVGGACPGDCNGNRVVTVDEMVAGVNLALGNAGASCDAMDSNQNRLVSIDELIRAVGALLSGC